MKKIYNWLVWSSANPEKIATTIKGTGIFVAPYILFFLFNFVGLSVEQNGLVDIITKIAELTGASLALFGLIRKFVITVKEFFAKK